MCIYNTQEKVFNEMAQLISPSVPIHDLAYQSISNPISGINMLDWCIPRRRRRTVAVGGHSSEKREHQSLVSIRSSARSTSATLLFRVKSQEIHLGGLS